MQNLWYSPLGRLKFQRNTKAEAEQKIYMLMN